MLIGIGSAAQRLAFITGLLSLKLTERCLVESWMVLLGRLSNISGLLIFSFAHTTALIFTGETTVTCEEVAFKNKMTLNPLTNILSVPLPGFAASLTTFWSQVFCLLLWASSRLCLFW